MSEEVKAIKRLEEITKDYSLNSEDLHYAIILYNLIINLQKQNAELKEENKHNKEFLNKLGFANVEQIGLSCVALKVENEKLKQQYCERTDCSGRIGNSKKVEILEKENKRLGNNWNELREWLEGYWKQSQDIWFVKIINKMQELEQKDENS